MKLNVQIDHRTFVVEVGDLNSRPVRVLVDGEACEVWPEEVSSAPTFTPPVGSAVPARLAAPAAAAAHVQASPMKAVLAPIPGVIISVAVKSGDTVAFGQELCVLEAMKMKNLIRANRVGTVAGVHVMDGDSVKHSQILIDYSD